jgi:hypothetical protein
MDTSLNRWFFPIYLPSAFAALPGLAVAPTSHPQPFTVANPGTVFGLTMGLLPLCVRTVCRLPVKV